MTGTVGTPVAVGSEPNLISETSDGNYLFLGLSGAKSLGRFNLLTQALDLTIPLTSNQTYNAGPATATSIAAIPGTNTTLAVEIDAFYGIGIFDITGSTGAFRKNSTFGYQGDHPVFVDATHFYAFNAATTEAEFYRYSVDASGVKLMDGTSLLGTGGFGGQVVVDQGLVYGSGGGIINPLTTPPSQVGVLPLGNGPYQTALVGGGAVPYAAEQKSFNVAINDAGTALTFLERFDTQHFVLEDQVQFPSSQIGPGVSGTRWGQDGLAFVLPAGYGGTSTAQVLVMRGAFVVPAKAVANAAPTLGSVGTGSLVAGSGNQYVSVTGSGFLPGASVLWNGDERSTTFVDAQHLQVAVGARDVQAGGTVTVTCSNPGSSSSNAMSLKVQ